MQQLHFKIYRAISPELKKIPLFKRYHTTMRPPKNVPYVVDNLWEWKRPERFPNRRHSLCASPTPELALEAAGGGTAYFVELEGKYKLCQIKNNKDSKMHKECSSLEKCLIDIIGMDWVNDLSAKRQIGKLWAPCMTKDEINDLFENNSLLKNCRNDIYNEISYWKDISLIRNGMDLPDPEGELFFEPVNGYYLDVI